jgi:hypothetical protein
MSLFLITAKTLSSNMETSSVMLHVAVKERTAAAERQLVDLVVMMRIVRLERMYTDWRN